LEEEDGTDGVPDSPQPPNPPSKTGGAVRHSDRYPVKSSKDEKQPIAAEAAQLPNPLRKQYTLPIRADALLPGKGATDFVWDHRSLTEHNLLHAHAPFNRLVATNIGVRGTKECVITRAFPDLPLAQKAANVVNPPHGDRLIPSEAECKANAQRISYGLEMIKDTFAQREELAKLGRDNLIDSVDCEGYLAVNQKRLLEAVRRISYFKCEAARSDLNDFTTVALPHADGVAPLSMSVPNAIAPEFRAMLLSIERFHFARRCVEMAINESAPFNPYRYPYTYGGKQCFGFSDAVIEHKIYPFLSFAEINSMHVAFSTRGHYNRYAMKKELARLFGQCVCEFSPRHKEMVVGKLHGGGGDVNLERLLRFFSDCRRSDYRDSNNENNGHLLAFELPVKGGRQFSVDKKPVAVYVIGVGTDLPRLLTLSCTPAQRDSIKKLLSNEKMPIDEKAGYLSLIAEMGYDKVLSVSWITASNFMQNPVIRGCFTPGSDPDWNHSGLISGLEMFNNGTPFPHPSNYKSYQSAPTLAEATAAGFKSDWQDS
jgi:hypothetical protein